MVTVYLTLSVIFLLMINLIECRRRAKFKLDDFMGQYYKYNGTDYVVNASAETSSFTDNLSPVSTTSLEVDTDSAYTTAEFSSNEDLSPRNHVKYGSKTDFLGKVVLITGANSGIGKAIAFHFAKLGATLSLSGLDFKKLYFTYKEIRPFATVKPHIPAGNLSHPDYAAYVLNYTINRFGRLDILINNAGAYEFGSIENTDAGQLQRLFDSNVKSMYSLTQCAVPYLEKTNGTIINISSLAGLKPFPGILAYCITKAAVDQFTKCLALELAPKNIRVNSVNPSVVDTGIHIRGGMDPEKYKEYIKNSKKKHPLKRITTVEDVAEAVAFLASDKAKFITGVNFPVDGGRSLCTP